MFALFSISCIYPKPLHFVGDFQRKRRFFVEFDVVVSDFGAHVAHHEGFQLNGLVLNGRKALVIVQEQSLYQIQAERHPKLRRNGVQRLGQVALFQSVEHPNGICADFGAKHFHAHRGGHVEPNNTILPHPDLPRQVVERHAVAFRLDAHVGRHPFKGLVLRRLHNFLPRGARGSHEQQGEERYG